MKYFVFRHSSMRWSWELRTQWGDVVARSPREFVRVEQAIASIRLLQFAASDAPICDVDERLLQVS